MEDDIKSTIDYAKSVMERQGLGDRAAAILRELAKNPPAKREQELAAELAEIEIKREQL